MVVVGCSAGHSTVNCLSIVFKFEPPLATALVLTFVSADVRVQCSREWHDTLEQGTDRLGTD